MCDIKKVTPSIHYICHLVEFVLMYSCEGLLSQLADTCLTQTSVIV